MSNASPSRRPLAWLRFDFWTLAEVVAGVGLAVALVVEMAELGAMLIGTGAAILFVAYYIGTADNRKRALRKVGYGLILLPLVVCLWIPARTSAPGPTAWRRRCTRNMELMASALQMYHSQWGRFPPAVVYNADGKPMHSWRTLILRHLEEWDVHDAYDFSQPWNSPHNRQVAASMPLMPLFCPSDPANPGVRASYFYVVGPGRTKAGKDALLLEDIGDDPSQTILLVESSSMKVDWFEPRDLTVEEALQGINPPNGPGMSSHHEERASPGRTYGGANVAFADGSAAFLSETLDRETLAALLTIDGGEMIDPSNLELPNRRGTMVWLIVMWSVFVTVIIWRRWGHRLGKIGEAEPAAADRSTP